MKYTHHSEYLPLKSVYIKSAKNAFISDTHIDAHWEALNYISAPIYQDSIEEYTKFQEKLIDEGCEIYHFSEERNVNMDSIYCRDASIATDFGMIICNMGKSGRANEGSTQRKEFIKEGIAILGEITSPGTLEGGDVAWLDQNTLAVGHGYRTNEEGIAQLKKMLEPKGITIIIAELPHYKGPSDVFHLMSILSPIDKDLAVVYSPLMPVKFRNELIRRGLQLVEVPEEEFDSMGCNVLAISPRKCIMVTGNPKTKQALLNAGCETHIYEGEHISVKGGGGPTCLTRPLLRQLTF